MRNVAIALLCLLTASEAQQAPSTKSSLNGPNLVVILHHPMNATITIKNVGTDTAKPSKLTLDCVRVESVSKMYSCPNLPASKMQTYFDAAFPNNATVQVPALAPGETFTHKLTFWSELNFPKGTYKFTAVVDAAYAVQAKSHASAASSMLVISQ